MSRPLGKKTDTEPLVEWEYLLILSHLADHWRLCCELLWETGIRIGEALAIKREDLKDYGVWITREKRKDALHEHLPLNAGLFARLRVYAFSHKDPRLFPFDSSSAWWAIKKAVAAAGIHRDIHPHSFRHGFGRRAMKANISPGNAMDQATVVQRMMGHKNIQSTLRYAQPSLAEITDAWRTMNQEDLLTPQPAP